MILLHLLPLFWAPMSSLLRMPWFFVPGIACPKLLDHQLTKYHSFVTGLVDTKIHGQRRTMFQRAMDLGLPASFVELRHEATHREPPSLVVLRKASQRSLEWLWDNYWVGIEDLGDFSAIQLDSSDSVKKAFRNVLRQFSTESASDTPSKKRKRDHEVSVAAQLMSICDASSEGVRSLPAALLERSTLIDSARE
jgi:ribosomal biogenesis protein LAS1